MGEGRGVCPRLVDYLCIVGSNKPPHRPYTTQQPDLLTRYPTTDHKDFPLPRDMVYFCQPDGCTFTSPKRPQARETQSFIFTLTDKDSGITRFGICLNFYRGIEKKGSPKASSKRDSWTRGTDRSTDSAFSSDYRSHSTVGPSDSDRERDTPRDLRDPAKVNEPLEPVFEPRPNPDSDNETIDPKNRRRRESGRKPNSKTQSLTSVCLISSHPFFSSFRSCLASFKRLVDACSGPNSRSKDRSGRKGSDQVWRVLTGAGSESVSSFLLHDIREIETWILRLLSAPIPISGRTRLEMEMIDRRYGPLLIFALPDPTRFTLCDFPLHLPLELLGVETTLQALTLIMLESKILVESRDLNALSLSVLSLTHLLYPLQYMFPVIPILPTSMIGAEQLLLAPTPYIIGLPSSFLPSKKNFSVPDDVWRVNLDSGKITPPPSQTLEDIPPLPEPEGKTLRSHLRQAVASLSIQPISNLDLMHPDKVAAILRNSRELDPSPSGYNPFIYGNDVDSVDIATRVAMVRFFNSPNVLANFTEHTRTLRLYPRPVVALQVNSLINSRPKNSTFITKLSSTQAVEFYAEWALMPSNLAFQRIHTGVLDPIVIGDKFKWYAHNLDPVSYIVWDNLSSLNQALKSLKEVDTPATDESGSDSECGSTSSSFSSCSDGIVHPNSSLGLHTDRSIQEQSYPGYLEKSERTSSLVNQSMNHQSGPILPVEETYTVRRQPPQLHGEHPSSEFQNRGWERSERSFGSQNGIPFGSMKVSHPRCPARSISPRGRLRPNVLEPQGCKTLQATRSCPIETELNPTRGSPFFGQPLGPTRSYPARSTRNYPGEGIEPNLLHPSDLSFSTPHPEPIRSHPSDASFSTPHSAPCHQPNQTFPLKYPGSELTSTDRRQQSPHQLNSSVPFDGVRRLEGGVLRRNTGVDQSRYTGVDQSRYTGVDQSSVYNPPKDLQVPSTDNPYHQPCSSEESQSEGESLSPLPPEHLNHPGVQCPKAVSEDAFTSESESSTATCKTVRNMGPKNMSQSTSVSFGSELSLEQESKPSSTLNKLAANFSVKFPRSRFSESSSSSGSRKVSESRQSSTEEVAQELFHNIEQFTKQAKKAAESLETAGKSAVEASKYKAIAKGYVKRDTIEDLEDVRKNVVDDFKTAMVKKNDIFKSLGDSGEKKVDEPTPTPGSAPPPPGPGVGQPAPSKPTSLDTSSCRDFSRQSSFNTKIGDDAVFDEPESTAAPFLSYIGTDISGLASQTSEFIGGLFGRGSISMPGSQTGSPTHTPRTTSFSRPVRNNQGPFPRGRRSIMERNSLIRHPSSRSIDTNRLNVLEQKNALSAENHSFIKDIVDQVLSGEGVGWLKINRLRKLMEDENYRNIILTKINRTIDRRIGPDDHLDDVVLKRSVYKGVLKILTSVIHGLEITVGNSGVGGMASAYQLLEISHTHYWTKDIAEPSDHLTTSGGTTVPGSLASTPLGGSRENINKLRIEGSSSLNYSDDYSGFDSAAESPFTSLPESTETSTGDLLKELIHQKKHLLLGRLASLESETESECNNSESGSIITNPAFHRTRGIFSSIRSAVSDTDVESNYLSSRGGSSNLWNCKSSLTSGYRYHGGDMVSTMQLPPPDLIRTYIFQGIINKDRSNIWDNPQVWEDIFLDAVAQEREATGMDTGTDLLMEHYRGLCESEKKRLEHEEDRLLSTMLFNLVAYMVMMQVNKNEIKKKIRRLLGKSHIGLVHSQEVSLLLEKLNQLNANDIDLRPLPSRQVNRQSFTVHAGTDATGDLLFLEVRDDGMVLRTVNGIISERWFFERLVNMTYSPKNKVLCLWRRQGGQTQLHKYYTKKCRDLYYSIKAAMERAASRGTGGVTPGMELGGEFPVQDIQSGEGGLLQVCMEGVGLLFANSKFFVRLDHIRKCFTQKEGIFVLEEFNPKTRKIVQRKYKSAMADQICYAVLCVFSYVAAGQNRKMADKVVKRNVAGHLPSGGVSPRGPMYSDRASLQFKRK